MKNKQKGITLIALVITIIVLLILAGVSISSLTGSGLFGQAQKAKQAQKQAEIDEKIRLILAEITIDKLGNPTIEDFLQKLKDNEIITDSDIKVENEKTTITVEDEFVYEITTNGKGLIQIDYKGTIQEIQSAEAVATLKVGNISNKKVDITIDTKNNKSEIQTYKLYVNNELVETLETNEQQVTINIDTTFGTKNCYAIVTDKAGNTIQTTEQIIEDYTIATIAELELFRDSVNSGNTYQGKNIELLNDINLNGSADNQWIPIGNPSNVFAGTFNGNGKVIENIYIDTEEHYQGFFSNSVGTIKNLGINSGTLKVGDCSGAILGYNNGGNIENCYNNASMYLYKGAHVGGIVGYSDVNSYITKCYNTADIGGNITSAYGSIAGISGYASKSTIEYCYNTGDVTATTEVHNTRASGISDGSNITIKSCYNIGDISVSTTSGQDCLVAAGVFGQMHAVKMYNCYNIGRTTVTSTSAILRNGALTGYFHWDATMENCYYLSTTSEIGVANWEPDKITEDDYEAIKVDTESEMKQIATLLGEDYVSDYTEEVNQLNGGYPILKWQTETKNNQ